MHLSFAWDLFLPATYDQGTVRRTRALTVWDKGQGVEHEAKFRIGKIKTLRRNNLTGKHGGIPSEPCVVDAPKTKKRI